MNSHAAKNYSDVVQTAQSYYNSEDADSFYGQIWGGEDIHIGLYESTDEPIRDASHRTVERMAGELQSVTQDSRGIDLGGGYAGSARYLARKFGCEVVSLNLSEVQNTQAREINQREKLTDLISVIDGDFENIPYDDNSFDAAWSQDAFLHSGNRAGVLAEIKRVLKPGGELIFTDPMQRPGCSHERLQPVLDRIQLESLGSVEFYDQQLDGLGFKKLGFTDLSEQLPRHYDRVRRELESRYDEMLNRISREYADNMIAGLKHWVTAGEAGDLRWGILHFRLRAD